MNARQEPGSLSHRINGLKIERETVDGREVFQWSVGTPGADDYRAGYCASVEDAASDGFSMLDMPVPHPERKHLDGTQQYHSDVYFQGEQSPANRHGQFSDWYANDQAAAAQSWREMEEQGYRVRSVEIGFPCKVVLEKATKPTLPTAEVLAKAFAARLLADIGRENLSEAVRLNREEKSPGVCHTHDFCDANCSMADVLAEMGINYGYTEDDAIMSLWNEAWAIAKRAEFYLEKARVS